HRLSRCPEAPAYPYGARPPFTCSYFRHGRGRTFTRPRHEPVDLFGTAHSLVVQRDLHLARLFQVPQVPVCGGGAEPPLARHLGRGHPFRGTSQDGLDTLQGRPLDPLGQTPPPGRIWTQAQSRGSSAGLAGIPWPGPEVDPEPGEKGWGPDGLEGKVTCPRGHEGGGQLLPLIDREDHDGQVGVLFPEDPGEHQAVLPRKVIINDGCIRRPAGQPVRPRAGSPRYQAVTKARGTVASRRGGSRPT